MNDADDFVICCKPGKAAEAMTVMRTMMGKRWLTVNEKKTRPCSLPEETFTFLGFTFGRQVSWKTGRPYLGLNPAQKKVQAIGDKIGEEASRSTTWRSVPEQVTCLNQMRRGWGNYFRMGSFTGAGKVVQQHTCRRLRQWMQGKDGQKGKRRGYPDMQLDEKDGLVQLSRTIRRIPRKA